MAEQIQQAAQKQDWRQALRLDIRTMFRPSFVLALAGLSAFFALCMVVGNIFSAEAAAFNNAGGNPVGRMQALAQSAQHPLAQDAGLFALWFVCVFAALVAILLCLRAIATLTQRTPTAAHAAPNIASFKWKHPTLFPLVLMLIAWLPIVVVLFPGTTDPYDNLDQICQMHGILFRTATWQPLVDPNVLLNNNNPVFHTVLLNSFFTLGEVVGSQNIGFFLFTFGQTWLMAWAFARTVACASTQGLPRWFVAGLLAFFCLNPLFPIWSMCATKDTLFTIITLHYVILAAQLVHNPNRYAQPRWLAVFFLLALAMMLVRNNGLFAMVFSLPVFFWAKEPKTHGSLTGKDRNFKKVGVAALAAIVCYMLFLNVVLPAAHVTPGSSREVLSVPFQQTARISILYPNDVTPEQRQTIANLVDYDHFPELYTPDKADPLKETYNPLATSDDVQAYLCTWVATGLQHPKTYVAASLANSYLYFYPEQTKTWIWVHLGQRVTGESLLERYHEAGVHISQPTVFDGARDKLSSAYFAFVASPFGILENMGFIAWGILFLFVIALFRKRGGSSLPFVPFLTLLLVCIASPENGNARYALPYIFAAPFLLTYTIGVLAPDKSDTAAGS